MCYVEIVWHISFFFSFRESILAQEGDSKEDIVSECDKLSFECYADVEP